MAVKQLSDGGSDGTVLGQNASDKIAFYGDTPVAQQAATLAAALTAGETTPADIAAVVVELYTALEALGLVRATA
jgi:hypothetical protein